MCLFLNLQYDFETFTEDSIHEERKKVVISYSWDLEKRLISFIFSPKQFFPEGF